VNFPATVDIDADPIIYAHAYALRGWRVLPIKPGEKRPPMGAWQKAATVDTAMIDKWWNELYRDHGVGIATGRASGIFVLDVDVAEDKAGDETLADLEARYGELPDTPTVETPSGGAHYYFKIPDGIEIRNDAGRRLGQGLDIRGEGGQVVAPPTARAVDAYEWVGETWRLEPADAPRWLIERIAELPKPETPDLPVAPVVRDLEDDDGPAQRYNQRTEWTYLLIFDKWTLVDIADDGEQRWTRPGKDPKDGISATVGHGGGDQLTVFTSSIPWLAEGSYSKFGYYAARFHAGDRSEAARTLRNEDYADVEAVLAAVPLIAPEATQALAVVEDITQIESRIELAHIIDWNTFWTDDYSDEEWLAYPVVPKGRAIALYAPAKAGKSTVVLAIAAAVASGRKVLGVRTAAPATVLYLDYEMTSADLQERLYELGYGPDADLSRLKYALLPSLPPMDTVEGARAILHLVEHYEADFVVFDTFGRAVEGEEDHADTVRAFYRHTGLTLKSKGVTYLRTDHSGKDVGKGMRGSSAKNDDVDLVWKLTRCDLGNGRNGVSLERTHSRISWVQEKLTIERVATGFGFDYRIDNSSPSFANGTAGHMDQLIDGQYLSIENQTNKIWDEIRHLGLMTQTEMRVALRMFKSLEDPDGYIKGRSRHATNQDAWPHEAPRDEAKSHASHAVSIPKGVEVHATDTTRIIGPRDAPCVT